MHAQSIHIKLLTDKKLDTSYERHLIQLAAVFIDRQLDAVTDWRYNVMANDYLFSSIVKPAHAHTAAVIQLRCSTIKTSQLHTTQQVIIILINITHVMPLIRLAKYGALQIVICIVLYS